MMHVVMVAAEAAPYVKVGGLADVLGALPRQLDRLGVAVDVIIPRYRIINLRQFSFARLPLASAVRSPTSAIFEPSRFPFAWKCADAGRGNPVA